MYEIQMEFIPGNSQIWVSHLIPNDPVYRYENYDEAVVKMEELKAADPTDRQYRIVEI